MLSSVGELDLRRPWAPAPWRDPHIWQRRKHAAGLARAPGV